MLPSRTVRSLSRASLFSAAISTGIRPVVLGSISQHQAVIQSPGICASSCHPPFARLSYSCRVDSVVASGRLKQDDMAPPLRDHITPDLLKEVLDFWFEHFTDEHQFVAPPQEKSYRWFKRDEDFDRACVAKFGSCLEAIASTEGVTANDLIATIDRDAPLEWIGLVLLLDQIPRNIYRGQRARTAYTVFDPLAQGVAGRAVQEGVFDGPEMRRRVAYRSWFLFPYMHSEDVRMHASCVEICESLVEDAKKMEDESDREDATKFAQTLLDFEKRHQKIVDRFGRYPHRNRVHGRRSTPEEEEYLRDGGEAFGG